MSTSRRTKPPFSLLLALLTVLALAQGGCGSENEPKEPRAQLSNTQFRQLEALYRVQVETEKMESKGESRLALEKTAKACAAVDDRDPLLAAAVNGCGEMAQFALSLANSECDSPSDCAKQLRVAATKTGDLVDTLRQNERAVSHILGETRCSEALASPRELLAAFRTLSHALREMATAIESGDDALMSKASKALEQSEADLESAPSATTLLKRFRQACA